MLLGRGTVVLRRLFISALAAAFVVTQAPHVAHAVTVKTLVRISGDVGYQQSSNSAYIPVTGQQEVPDNAFIVTRGNGVADLVMPDSSVIRIAQAAMVQVGEFHQPGSGDNIIQIRNGSFRFKVQHPAGGQANYKFVTPTSQIAVRGTEGLGKVTTDVTQVSNTFSTTPNDVQVAAVKTQFSYLAPDANADALRTFLHRGDPLDEVALANADPERYLIAQVQIVFTALAQGFTATVTSAGVVVGQYVLSAAALGVSGSLSAVSVGATASGAITSGTTAASAAGIGGTAVITGAAAAAAAGGLAAAAANANSGVTAVSPTPSPTASVNITITSTKRAPEAAPAPATTPPPAPAPPPGRK